MNKERTTHKKKITTAEECQMLALPVFPRPSILKRAFTEYPPSDKHHVRRWFTRMNITLGGVRCNRSKRPQSINYYININYD
jgi:hypothetical protein